MAVRKAADDAARERLVRPERFDGRRGHGCFGGVVVLERCGGPVIIPDDIDSAEWLRLREGILPRRVIVTMVDFQIRI